MGGKERIFAHNGTLRDICAIDANLAIWDTVLSSLHSSPWDATCQVSSDSETVPGWSMGAEAIFAGLEANALSVAISVQIGHIWLSGHMFTEDEIEFVFDPTDISSASDRNAVVDFCQWLSRVTGLMVVITDEAADHMAVPWLASFQ